MGAGQLIQGQHVEVRGVVAVAGGSGQLIEGQNLPEYEREKREKRARSADTGASTQTNNYNKPEHEKLDCSPEASGQEPSGSCSEELHEKIKNNN